MNVQQHECPAVKDLVHPETDERAEMTLCDYEQAGGNLRQLQAQAERHDHLDLFEVIVQHKTSLRISWYRTVAARLDAVDKASRKLKKAKETLAVEVFNALEDDVRVVDIAELLDISRWSVYRLSNRGSEELVQFEWDSVDIDEHLDNIDEYNYLAKAAEASLWERIAEAKEARATYNDLRVVSGHSAETIRSHLRRRQTKEKDDPD